MKAWLPQLFTAWQVVSLILWCPHLFCYSNFTLSLALVAVCALEPGVADPVWPSLDSTLTIMVPEEIAVQPNTLAYHDLHQNLSTGFMLFYIILLPSTPSISVSKTNPSRVQRFICSISACGKSRRDYSEGRNAVNQWIIHSRTCVSIMFCKFPYQTSVSFSASLDASLVSRHHDVNSFLKDCLCVRPIFVRCITLRVKKNTVSKINWMDGLWLELYRQTNLNIPFSSYYRSAVSEDQMFSIPPQKGSTLNTTDKP